MFRINLLSGIFFKVLRSCACLRSAVVIVGYLLIIGPAPASAGEPTPFVVLTGESAGSVFGGAVSSAGDVNDDGVDDVIVGADFGFSDGLGRAYVFFGGSEADAVADLTLNGEAGISQFGRSVSEAGDINGDGFDDVIVGASSPYVDPGRAYLFFGGPGADETADLVLYGEWLGDGFGVSVSDLGDFNGDGFDDVIVGACANDSPGSNAGRAYVYFGGPSLDGEADVILNAEEADDYFGFSVSGAGDANADGFNDVFVGARSNEIGEPGHAYLYYGGPEFDSLADLTVTENTQFPGFAHSVSGAVDVNGDGFNEVIVGHFYGEIARIYYGVPQPDATPTPDLTLTAEMVGDYFGVSVSGAGDLNGDNYGDVIIGAAGCDAGGTDAGRAYVYLGGKAPDTIADLTLTGEASGDGFSSVSDAGDFNGDGYGDLIVGAPGNDDAGFNTGRAYVYLGGSELTAGGQDVTGVGIDSPATGHVLLSPPRPNPLFGARPSLVQFKLNRPSPVRLFLQDVRGRTVADRERESFASGTHSVSWNPGKLPSGVYYLRVEAGGDVASTKWVIVR